MCTIHFIHQVVISMTLLGVFVKRLLMNSTAGLVCGHHMKNNNQFLFLTNVVVAISSHPRDFPKPELWTMEMYGECHALELCMTHLS
jgi:hypothetical protein